MDNEVSNGNMCRVCRCEGLVDHPLFHPCICSGTIKWIHQECLVRWMRYSRKENCELCGHRFAIMPIYSPDMPRRLPFKTLVAGLLSSIAPAVEYWLHYALLVIAWAGIIPLTVCRIYRALFAGSINAIVTLPFEMLSTENLGPDIFQGCFVVICTLFALGDLVWLREHIFPGGRPDWLQRDGVGLDNIPEEDRVEGEDVEGHDPIAAQDQDPQEENDDNVREDNNWNPTEWDQPDEEITWQRSLTLLDDVFWAISLNTLFILIFAYFPYHMGLMTLSMFHMSDAASESHFKGLITTLLGYCSIGVLFVILHRIAACLGFNRAQRVLKGLCYVVVKVSVLSFVKFGIIPLARGWLLDICSLTMFDATLQDRENSFSSAPGTSVFIHWLIGMFYAYYFTPFILLIREILRPGVLWFLRNDPDFITIQEIIDVPLLEHIRKILISAVIFGSGVLLMLWLPIKILKMLVPSFLPYTVSLNNVTQVKEFSLELLLLQVILPVLLEQSQTMKWLKGLMRNWCKVVAWMLNVHSYLLGDEDGEQNGEEENENGPVNAPEAGRGLGAVHQALLMMEPPTDFQPYNRPPLFVARLLGLVIIVCISLVASSLVALTLPVWLGRSVMALWLAGAPPAVFQTEVEVHELYTAACGLYLCWMAARAVTLVMSWLPQGRAAMIDRLNQWFLLGLKTIVAGTILLVIPLLFGLLLELVVVIPLRVPIHQTPIVFLWQDWALGVLYTKLACAFTIRGPDWFLRSAIERAYTDGIRDMNLTFIFKELVGPVIIGCGLALSIPYAFAYSVMPIFVANLQARNFIARRLYPFLLLVCMVGVIINLQIRQFRKLYEHIKNDKYLVGQRLVNYDHRKKTQN